MAAHRVTLIPGDGTGPEIAEATRRVIDATGVEIEWDVQEAGADVMDRHGGNPLPDHVLESIRRNSVAIKGPITTPVGTGFRSVNVALRKTLDLYGQVRPCKIYPGVRSRYEDVDLVIVRENTEDLYAGIEFEEGTDEARELIDWLAARGSTVRAGLRDLDQADLGHRHAPDRRVRLRLRAAQRPPQGHGRPQGQHHEVLRRALPPRRPRGGGRERRTSSSRTASWTTSRCSSSSGPRSTTSSCCPNLYGDVVSDLAAGLIGGLGLAPGGNFGTKAAVFEPTHGSAPKYTGQNKVNPMAMMLSGVMMLRHLEERDAADRLEGAIAHVIAEGRAVTYDMKPTRDDPTRRRDERRRGRDHRPDGSEGLRRKVTVVGAGNVGATAAQEIARRDYADVVLVDIKEGLPQGKALDIAEAGPVLGYEPTISGRTATRRRPAPTSS